MVSRGSEDREEVMTKLMVHKYGSSVLADESRLDAVVDSIYASIREGYRVIAVVSAMGDTTDTLLAEATAFGDGLDDTALAMLLSTGELRSAALLTLALARAGLAAGVMDAGAVELRTTGALLDAAPQSVSRSVIQDYFESQSVLVVPGFLGRGESDQTTLLGRGGSDLTALFLAAELDADCVLFKDVDGIYEADPNTATKPVRRYESMTWETALQVGGRVLQSKAVGFARERGLTFSVRALGGDSGTAIGDLPVVTRLTPPREGVLRVVLLGLGTVGLGVYRRLLAQPDVFEVVGVVVRDADKLRPADIDRGLLTTDINDALEREHDVTVEVMGGLDDAHAGIERSLRRGRLVVTANKDLVAEYGEALVDMACQFGGKLLYGAAVGGAVPCVEAVQRLAAEEYVTGFCGVVNGTTNFILDAMACGSSFESALVKAQEAGFAEADPSADVDGLDAARKLVILIRHALGDSCGLDDISWKGIAGITTEAIADAQRDGRAIRLVARFERGADGFVGKVGPESLPLDHSLAQVGAEHNALELWTESGVVERWLGAGAGRWPTAQAVVGDLLAEVNQRRSQVREKARVA